MQKHSEEKARCWRNGAGKNFDMALKAPLYLIRVVSQTPVKVSKDQREGTIET